MCDGLDDACLEDSARGGCALMPQNDDRRIVFDNVSKSYGEVLGVNQVNLAIEPGITSLVGPNGAGKTTLMNLMTGLLLPTKGTVRVLGVSPGGTSSVLSQHRILFAV
jgi:ABC-type multidrug transport system ATPase subunit